MKKNRTRQKKSQKRSYFQGPAFHKADLEKVIRGWRKAGYYSQPCKAVPVSDAYMSLRRSVPKLCVVHKELTEVWESLVLYPLVEAMEFAQKLTGWLEGGGKKKYL